MTNKTASAAADAALERIVPGLPDSVAKARLRERELLAETSGLAFLGVTLLDLGRDLLAFPLRYSPPEQDCYDETVRALGFDPLDGAA
jgi:hypothetical protein